MLPDRILRSTTEAPLFATLVVIVVLSDLLITPYVLVLQLEGQGKHAQKYKPPQPTQTLKKSIMLRVSVRMAAVHREREVILVHVLLPARVRLGQNFVLHGRNQHATLVSQ